MSLIVKSDFYPVIDKTALDELIDTNELGYTGSHTGADNASVLTDSAASFPTDGSLLYCKIKNITDGSEGIITENTENTITATLSGGTDNDWDIDDEYEIKNLLQATIDAVVDFMADMISGNYQLSEDKLPQILKAIGIDLVLYNLYAKIAAKDVPNLRKERYDNSMKLLEKIGNGKIQIGLTKSTQDENVYKPEFKSNTRVFATTREVE